MNALNTVSRRDFLRSTGLGAAVCLTGRMESLLPHVGMRRGTLRTSPTGSTPSLPDVEVALRATPSLARILPGAPTQVWTYQASLLRGSAQAVQVLAGSYLGPVIRVRQGQRLRVQFINGLPEKSLIHWHGLHVPPAMDGHPRDAIHPGQTYTYDFPVLNRAGTYWYHAHPDMRTGPQVYSGLAGLLLVSDEEEDAAGLPTGAYDVPLVLQDRTFSRSNQLVYSTGGMMDSMMGFLGERILVNGQPDFVLPVATRSYRLRLLNGSNSRIYKLAWSDGMPLTVIGTDGGLLETAATRNYVMLSPGERVDLWTDFSGRTPGTTLHLMSLPFSGVEGSGGMMSGGGMMGNGMRGAGRLSTARTGRPMGASSVMLGQPMPNGASFNVLTVQVRDKVHAPLTLPDRLSRVPRHRLESAVNRANPRGFDITFRNMQWLLNGRSFEMERVADNEIVQLDTLEAWEIVNRTNPGEMMEPMGMAHPLHIHGVQFQVIERRVVPELAAGWETVSHGYVDEGWKDTILVMPGERVKLLLRFGPYPGLYLYHCHNLEHEDMGMMRNYLIRG
jgi:blue copper oxidase